jgi:hypothetical protein
MAGPRARRGNDIAPASPVQEPAMQNWGLIAKSSKAVGPWGIVLAQPGPGMQGQWRAVLLSVKAVAQLVVKRKPPPRVAATGVSGELI